MASNSSNNIKYDSIDEVIIRLLGLQSGLELDYQTYYEIIKKKLAMARLAGKELPREEDELLREELKRVRRIKDSGERFKVRKKKTKVSKTAEAPPSNQKALAPSGGAIMRSPKEILSPKDIIPAKLEIDESQKNTRYSDLTQIQKSLDSILELLISKFKLNEKILDRERKEKELEKRGKKESSLEGIRGTMAGIANATKKLLSPLSNVFEKIKRFLFFVLLGRAFTKFIEWLKDGENRKKFNYFIDFLKDHLPAIAGLYILFGTSFGKLVRGLLKLSARLIVALGVNIPRIFAFIKKNKKLAFLAVAAAPIASREFTKIFSDKGDNKDENKTEDGTKDLEAAKTDIEKAKNIDIKSSPKKPDVSGISPGGGISGLTPGISGGSDTQKVPALFKGGLVSSGGGISGLTPGVSGGSDTQKVPALFKGGLVSPTKNIFTLASGGLVNKLSSFYNGGVQKNKMSLLNVQSGIPITGAGQDDTLIAAKTGEAVLTKKDQKDIKKKYVHKETGKPLDIPNYLSDRKPGKVSSDKIKFNGGFLNGGVISKFNEGGIVGGNYSLPPAWEQRRNERRESSYSLPPAWEQRRNERRESRYSLPPAWEQRRQKRNYNSIPGYQKGGIIDSISNIGQNIGSIFTKNPKDEKNSKSKGKKEYRSTLLNKRARYIFDRLVRGGLTKVAAGGAVANIGVETDYTYDPNMHQYNGGPGRGLVQWEKGKGRFDLDPINLVDFAKKRKKPWNDMNTQIDFILHEMKVHPEFKEVKKELNQQKNIEGATQIFLEKYEKAGEPHFDRRLKVAKEIVKEGYLIEQPKTSKPTKPKGFFEQLKFPGFQKGGGIGSDPNNNLSRMDHAGLVKENTGLNYGSGPDRQLIAVSPREYVVPSRAVEKIGANNLDKVVAATDSNSRAASERGSLNFKKQNDEPIKMQKGGLISNQMMKTNMISNQFVKKGSTQTNSDYLKYFLTENFFNPKELKSEEATSRSLGDFIDYFKPNPKQRQPKITPYTPKASVTTLPPIDMSKGMPSMKSKENRATKIPSFSAISPVNDRDLNAKTYYGIE